MASSPCSSRARTHAFDDLGDIDAADVLVDHHLVARPAAEQLVERHVRGLGLDVPERHVDGADRGHGDRAAAPVGALVEVLPDVLGAHRVLADEASARRGPRGRTTTASSRPFTVPSPMP